MRASPPLVSRQMVRHRAQLGPYWRLSNARLLVPRASDSGQSGLCWCFSSTAPLRPRWRCKKRAPESPHFAGDPGARRAFWPRPARRLLPQSDAQALASAGELSASASSSEAGGYSTSSYEGGGAVPKKLVINITVQARPATSSAVRQPSGLMWPRGGSRNRSSSSSEGEGHGVIAGLPLLMKDRVDLDIDFIAHHECMRRHVEGAPLNARRRDKLARAQFAFERELVRGRETHL